MNCIQLYNAGCIFTEDVQNEEGNFLTCELIEIKYSCTFQWLWYAPVINVIPPMWKMILQTEHLLTIERINFSTILNITNTAKVVYTHLIRKDANKIILPYVGRFNALRNVEPLNIEEYCNLFSRLYKITDSYSVMTNIL